LGPALLVRISDVHPFGRGRLRQAELGPRLADHLQERLRRHGLRSVQTEPGRCRQRAVGVYTVEQLLGISADGMAGIGMGAQDYVNMAQKFLAIVGAGPSLRERIGELRDADGPARIA
jgi:hypothetical protein